MDKKTPELWTYQVELYTGETVILYDTGLLSALATARKFHKGTFTKLRRVYKDGTFDGWWEV